MICLRRKPSVRPHPIRGGFTILELLVGVGIVGILMALILPAVQSARESARRVECQQHLRQFGIAIHSFEESFQEYPRWRGPVQRRGQSVNYSGFSPHAQLLVQLDQRPLAQDEAFQRGDSPTWQPRVLSSPYNQFLAVFHCPSDNGRFGTNYRGCTGPDPQEIHRQQEGGVFGRVDATRPRDVTDGTSQTVMMSEKLISDLSADFDPSRDYWFTGLSVILPDSGEHVTANQMLAHCGSLVGNPGAYFPYAGLEWSPSTYNDTLYNHVAGPNSSIPDCSLEGSPPNTTLTDGRGGNAFQESGSFGASSSHPGGVFALLADGAVHFFANSIDLSVWRAMATIAGQEVIGF